MAVLQHELTLGEAAEQLSRALPGHRVEILQGRLVVTPPPDGSHALSLSWLVEAFGGAGARKAGLRYVQGIGLWLPALPDDYAIPDFSVVDEDFRDALVQKNCYAPNAFRLVMEVTSSNWSDDLGPKVESYAQALHPGLHRGRPQTRRGAAPPEPGRREVRRAPALQTWPERSGPRLRRCRTRPRRRHPPRRRLTTDARRWSVVLSCDTPPHAWCYRPPDLSRGTRADRSASRSELAVRAFRRRPQGHTHGIHGRRGCLVRGHRPDDPVRGRSRLAAAGQRRAVRDREVRRGRISDMAGVRDAARRVGHVAHPARTGRGERGRRRGRPPRSGPSGRRW